MKPSATAESGRSANERPAVREVDAPKSGRRSRLGTDGPSAMLATLPRTLEVDGSHRGLVLWTDRLARFLTPRHLFSLSAIWRYGSAVVIAALAPFYNRQLYGC